MHPKAQEVLQEHAVSKPNWREEWRYDGMIDADDVDNHCECGHAIRYLFYIANILTNEVLVLGSVCIRDIFSMTVTIEHLEEIRRGKRAMIPYEDLFDIRRLRLLSDWEMNFLRSVGRKKKISPKQEKCYSGIVAKLLEKIKGETLV